MAMLTSEAAKVSLAVDRLIGQALPAKAAFEASPPPPPPPQRTRIYIKVAIQASSPPLARYSEAASAL